MYIRPINYIYQSHQLYISDWSTIYISPINYIFQSHQLYVSVPLTVYISPINTYINQFHQYIYICTYTKPIDAYSRTTYCDASLTLMLYCFEALSYEAPIRRAAVSPNVDLFLFHAAVHAAVLLFYVTVLLFYVTVLLFYVTVLLFYVKPSFPFYHYNF